MVGVVDHEAISLKRNMHPFDFFFEGQPFHPGVKLLSFRLAVTALLGGDAEASPGTIELEPLWHPTICFLRQ